MAELLPQDLEDLILFLAVCGKINMAALTRNGNILSSGIDQVGNAEPGARSVDSNRLVILGLTAADLLQVLGLHQGNCH